MDACLHPAPPAAAPDVADYSDQASQQRRRLNFIRAERLSLSESREIPGDFDPGPEYDTP